MIALPRRSMRLAIASCVLLPFAACRDTDVPPTALESVSSTAAVVASPDDTNWNVFEADVDVSADGSTSPVSHAARSRGLSFHIIRRRAAGGDWVTIRDFGPVIPGSRTKDVGFAGPPRLSRVVESRGQMEFYDMRGRRVTPPRPAAPVPMGRGAAQPRPSTGRMPMASLPNLTPYTADSSRNWVDRYLVTPAGVARGRGHLERSGRERTSLGNGHSRYAESRGKDRIEIDVDESTGLIDAVRLATGGRVISEARRTYTRRADGVYVLETERLRQFTNRSGAASQETVVRYRNVRLLEDR